jgi:hypothetical protein
LNALEPTGTLPNLIFLARSPDTTTNPERFAIGYELVFGSVRFITFLEGLKLSQRTRTCSSETSAKVDLTPPKLSQVSQRSCLSV